MWYFAETLFGEVFIFGLFSAQSYDFWIKGVILKVLITDNWSLTIVVLRWNLFRRSIYLSSVRVKQRGIKPIPFSRRVFRLVTVSNQTGQNVNAQINRIPMVRWFNSGNILGIGQ